MAEPVEPEAPVTYKVTYLGQSYDMDEENYQQLVALNVPYVDKKLLSMTPAEAIYNMQKLQQLTAYAGEYAMARANQATLQRMVRTQQKQIAQLQSDLAALMAQE